VGKAKKIYLIGNSFAKLLCYLAPQTVSDAC